MENLTLKSVLVLFLLVFGFRSYTQDTVFVNKHHFDTPVRNVFEAEGKIYVRTGARLFVWDQDRWKDTGLSFQKPYVFYKDGFYDAEYLPRSFKQSIEHLEYLIPQQSRVNPTSASKGNRFFLSVGGSLFEYRIDQFYSRSYRGKSIRDIFIQDTLKIVSTYSGIFINDSVIAAEPRYSSGSLDKIGSRYFLSSDKLFELQPNGSFEEIDIGDLSVSGNVRRSLLYKGDVYLQHTLSISRVDSVDGLETIHDGNEYVDIEVVDNELWFCTTMGAVFSYDGNVVKSILNLDTKISDIYSLRNQVYFSTDKGLYLINKNNVNSLKLVTNLADLNGVRSDIFNNLWISTDNGLFIIPDNSTEVVPFINDMEFNRGAIEHYYDTLYFGSIDGVYMIDVHGVYRQFLPELAKNKPVAKSIADSTLAIAVLVFVILSVITVYYFRGRSKDLGDDSEEISLGQLEEDIRQHGINSVEVMAEFYKTNPVQLNRILKNFDTTPGKFLKHVKLKMAFEMTDAGVPITEISRVTGYSAIFIKSQLKLQHRRHRSIKERR